MYKNIEKQAVLQLKDLVEYQTGQVVSKTLVQNDKVSMTIFSFDKGEEISTHAAGGDAMVTGGYRKVHRRRRSVPAPRRRNPDHAQGHSPCCLWRGTVQDAADRFVLILIESK